MNKEKCGDLNQRVIFLSAKEGAEIMFLHVPNLICNVCSFSILKNCPIDFQAFQMNFSLSSLGSL